MVPDLFKASTSPSTTRKGSALVIALVVLTIVATMGAVFLQVTTSTTRRQVAEGENLRAFYLAEAGLAESFQALRIGRTGQVGSEAEPAIYGGGLLWVDAIETSDDQVRLTSTALVGRGRATLALVVEPIESPLGFFSDEDLIVDEVLLVDGFNSEEASYEEDAASMAGLHAFVQWLISVIGLDGMEMLLTHVTAEQLATYAALDPSGGTGLASLWSDLLNPCLEAPTSSVPEQPTISRGLLGSNGAVDFATSGEPNSILGDVVPGPDSEVSGLDGVVVIGDTHSRPVPVELEPVNVPSVSLVAPVRHDGLLPMVVSPGTSGHEGLEVAVDSELILRGPATIVIGELVLEPGATLTLDTRDGDVALYVSGGMDLQSGSEVVTTSDFPNELSIQVAEIPTGMGGAPVKLEATSQFHGTIYAPQTDVRVGGAFEVYGGIVAKRLEIGAGARLHFDNATYEGSPIPRVVSWRIVEIPTSVRGWRVSPYQVLGVERGTLETMAEAHDLESVTLSIEYLDPSGVLRNYDGGEDQFDWNWVGEVVALQRDATRVQEDPTSIDPKLVADPVDLEPVVREDVTTSIDLFQVEKNSTDLVDQLIVKLPLTSSEWTKLDTIGLAADEYSRLKAEDIAAGGTGGLK